MESPKDPTKISSKETTPVRHNNASPLNRTSNKKHLQSEFSAYGLHRESSPIGFGSAQDTLEIGWGDSPEPIRNEKKFPHTARPERPEQKESPRSTCSFKYRRQRAINLPPKSPVDVAKYIAQVKELSKCVMKEMNSQQVNKLNETPKHSPKMDGNQNSVTSTPIIDDLCKLIQEDDSINEDLIACTQTIESKLAAPSNSENQNSKLGTNKDSLFDKELQSFFNEEDDWLLSTVDLSNQTLKQTPRKGSFVKSRSDNNLESPRVESTKKVLSSQTNKQSVQVVNTSNSFRRTNSFDITKVNVRTNGLSNSEPKQCLNNSSDAFPPLKKQKSFSMCLDESKSVVQYSEEEIKKKREQAELRKQAKLIERKRLEALKKLEMKKKNGFKMSRQSSFGSSR